MGITAAPHSTARMSSSAISYTSCPLVRGIDLQAIQWGSGANWWEAGASVVSSLSYLALLSPPTLGVSITRRTGRIFQPIGRTSTLASNLAVCPAATPLHGSIRLLCLPCLPLEH